MGQINFGLMNTNAPAEIGNSLANAFAQRRQVEMQNMQLEGAKSQNALAAMQMKKAQGDMEEESAYKNALRGVQNGDYGSAMPQLMGASPSRALALQKQLSEQKKSQVGIDKDQLDMAIKRAAAMRDAMPALYADPTDENAQAIFSRLVHSGLMTQEEAVRGVQMFVQTPMSGRRDFLKFHMQKADQLLESQKPKLQAMDLGGSQQIVDMNPETNPGITGQRFSKSLSPAGAVAAQGNQLMRDLMLQERQFKVDEARAKAEERGVMKQTAIDGANDALTVIDKAISHPGREVVTGMSGVIDPRNYLRGNKAADFTAVIDQIKGKAFLQAFESLKGGGQITEVEGKKATDAIARLDTAQSDEEFLNSLRELRGIVETGLSRLNGGAAKHADAPAKAQPQGGAFSSMPSPGQYKGKVITDTETGIKYRSNGSVWVKE